MLKTYSRGCTIATSEEGVKELQNYYNNIHRKKGDFFGEVTEVKTGKGIDGEKVYAVYWKLSYQE